MQHASRSLTITTSVPHPRVALRLSLPSVGRRCVRVMALQPAKPDTLDASLTALEAAPKPHYVLFTADPDPATGRPWCPDCVRSQDAVRDAVKATGGTLLEVEVGPRTAWKTPDHPFRHDPRLKLTGIPTIFKFEGGAFGARIGPELESANSPAQVQRVLEKFLGSSSSS